MPLDLGGSVILRYGDKQYKDLASLRAEAGQEIHGRVVTEFDPAPLGLVTFRRARHEEILGAGADVRQSRDGSR